MDSTKPAAATAPWSEAFLPWETVIGPPKDVGICLSGGGLRAASFSMGVLQALQHHRKLLFGRGCARYLAAVSGGSYIAASYVLGGQRRATAPDEYADLEPLAPTSPEEAHILSNGQYLKSAVGAMLALTLVNFAALLVLFVYFGTILGGMAAVGGLIGDYALPQLATLARDSQPYLFPVLLFLLGAAVWLWWSNVYKYGLRSWRTIPVFVFIWAISAPVVRVLGRHSGWESPVVSIAALGVGLSVLLVWLVGRFAAPRGIVVVANFLALSAPRLLGAAFLALTAAWWYRQFDSVFTPGVKPSDVKTVLALYFVSLVLGLWFSYVPNRASLHRAYRDRLTSCFGVVRMGGSVEQTGDAALSHCAPPENDARYPRLLVCATANARVPDATKGDRWFAPFVMSYDLCGVPGNSNAGFSTRQLELIYVPRALGESGSEPVLSLFTAVAAAGAALSPSMGRETRPILRLIFSLINARLGRWLPNVFVASTRGAVSAETTPRPLWSWIGERKVELERGLRWFRPSFSWPGLRRPILVGAMSPGYDELIPELLGLQGPGMYVTDGGHYDNLGLLALLRAKCAEIWCVDSSPDKRGVADELDRVLSIAGQELGITNDVDLQLFAVGDDGLNGATHVVGELTYPDQMVVQLHILKLGLTTASPQSLLSRRQTDPGFPWHPTWKQWYAQDRMDAYRRLGWDVAERCLSTQPN